MSGINIVAYGGGSNSRAMIIGMYYEGISIDYILFADPGGELPHTYEGNKEFNKWLKSKGLPTITEVKYEHTKQAYDTLEEECLLQNKLPSIAYGGIKSCSGKWKMYPQEKFVKELPEVKKAWENGERINRYVGYDYGEEKRIDNAKKYDRVNKEYNNIYWLYENEWDRQKCIDVIKNEGMTLPGKSSCFFCPNMSPLEIIEMYERYPEYYQRAVELEHNANLTKIKGLGRTWSWEEFINTYIKVKEDGVNKEKTIIKVKAIMKDKAKQLDGQTSLCDFMEGSNMPCGCYD